MAKFKRGDKVRCHNDASECTGIIMLLPNEYNEYYNVQRDDGKRNGGGKAGLWNASEGQMELIESSTTTMNTLEKFALVFKSEPEKSLRKAGLLNGDDLATQDGLTIYVSYLMKKDKTFQDEIVKPLVEEAEKKN